MTNPSQPDPLVGKVLAERFEILSRIGEGGTGVVYKAKQITVDRVVAIKVLGAHVSSDPAWVKRFHNEARAAARLDHPNTVRLIDFGETKEGLFFIAMEFLQGRALSDEITKRGNLAPQRALKILSQVCQSLSEAHTQGIIHRDIKPDNIFLIDTKGGGDFVKVLDFSVAKMEGGDAQQTRAGTVFGTPQYMSPEQARGAKLSPQSDLYSCGIVAYEMLTGKPPFEGALPMEVLMMHLRNKPAPLVGFPEAVSKVVMKALEKTPERRQASAEEMHRDCLISLEQQYPGSTGASGTTPAASRGRRTPSTISPPPRSGWWRAR
jgi:serine/threonine-protein kinase